MAFSTKIKIKALNASARHCCVCHRYKGVKVEVHHIVPVSQGGKDNFENAIVLCFDCHADAGHYNPKHPRGLKFSTQELKKARDLWYLIVKGNGIQAHDTKDLVYTRYLLCKENTAINEILKGDLSSIPVPDPILLHNDVLEFQKEFFKMYVDGSKPSQIFGESFKSSEEYSKKYPNVRVFKRSDNYRYPYFRAIRFIDREEIITKISEADPLYGILAREDIPTDIICIAMAYDEFCGDCGFQEVYKLRSLWTVYQEIKNISESPIKIISISGKSEHQEGISFRSIHVNSGKEDELALPSPAILPGQSVVIPLLTLLAPLDEILSNGITHHSEDLESGQVQQIKHEDFSKASLNFHLLGPAFWPRAITIIENTLEFIQPVHELDLSNLYSINRYWEMGSCPHCFIIDHNNIWKYYSEFFAKSPSLAQYESIEVHENMSELVLVELEDEITIIKEIRKNGEVIDEDRILCKGDSVMIKIAEGDVLNFLGYYSLLEKGINPEKNPFKRNELIFEYLNHANT